MRKLLPLLIISSLYGHDLYLMPQKFRPAAGETILLSVHTGDSFPISEQPVDPARLTSLPAMPDSAWRMLNKATHATVTVQDGSQFFAVQTKARFLEMEPAKFEAYLREEGLTAQLALRKEKNEATAKGREMYAKFAKTYVVAGNPNASFSNPLGLKIEIVPLADPSSLKPGASLPVQLLYMGKPLADSQIEIATSSDPRKKTVLQIAGRTNKDGKLDISIPSSGKVRLHSLKMERVNEATHDWESSWASLTFEVPSTPGAQSTTLSNR